MPLTPAQQREAYNFTRSMQKPAMTFSEFLAARGQRLPDDQSVQQSYQEPQRPDIAELLKSIGGEEGLSKLKNLISPSTSAALAADTPVASAIDGGTVLADGTVAPFTSGASTLGDAASAWDFGNIGSAGNGYLPALGAVGLYDMFANKRGSARGAAQGAASGAAVGSYFGPWGTGIGAAVGGLSSLLNRKTTGEIQDERWAAAGRSDLKDSHKGVGYAPNNQDFQRTRDEKYLTADDIRVNPDNYNNVQDWDTWSPDQQNKFLNTLLQEGKVREKKGGIYYDDNRAQQLANEIRNGTLNTTGVSNGQPITTKVGSVPGQIMIPRSKTRSPGIGLDGRRISY